MRRDEAMERNEVWAELRKRNAVKAEVYFSGGNDEGGVDNISLFDKDNKETELSEHSDWDYSNGRGVKKELTAEQINDNRFYNGLAAPVYAEYGSFAGEFHVNGTITYDVLTNKVKKSGSESVSHDEEFEEDL